MICLTVHNPSSVKWIKYESHHQPELRLRDESSPYANRDPPPGTEYSMRWCYFGLWSNGNQLPHRFVKIIQMGEGVLPSQISIDRSSKNGTTYMGLSNDGICRNPAWLCAEAVNGSFGKIRNTAREKAIAQLNRICCQVGITIDLLAADYNQATSSGNAHTQRTP